MRSRRIGVAVGITGGLAAVGAAAWLWWIPSAVESKIAEAAHARGLSATVGSVGIGLSETHLRNVRARRGASLDVEISDVTIRAGAWSLLTSGSGAIQSIRASGGRARLDLDDPIWNRAAAGPADREPSRAPIEVEVEGADVELRDRSGVLASVRVASARLSPERITATASTIAVAPGSEDGADLGRTEVILQRRDGQWTISRASFASPAIRYREREGDARSPLLARLARHASWPSGPGPAAAAPATEPEGRGEAIARAAGRLAAFLAPGARVSVDDLSVAVAGGEEEESVLRELRAEVRVLEGQRYELEGSGRPGRGGRLSWRLSVAPAELRADGNIDLERVPFALFTPLLPSIPWHEPERARVTGALTIRGQGAERVHFEGGVSVEDLALSSERIAPQPVRRVGVSLHGEGDWIPEQRRLEIASMELGMRRARLTLRGALEWAEDHYLVDVRATLPPTECSDAMGAIPTDLLAETAGFLWDGRLGGQLVARVDSRDLPATQLDIHVANGCRFLTAPAVADVARFGEPFTHRVLEPDGTVFEMETGPGTLTWTPLAQVSPFLVHAVLGHEDAAFFSHRGFSTSSIRQALIRNLEEGRYAYGASTITMQLVKNVFLRREKTLARKVQEVLLTWWVETAMDKRSILELYLNVIEYGPGIYGIRQAARHYFGCEPALLTPAQSAYLAMILPSPKAFHSHYVQGAVPEAFRRRAQRFLRILGERGRYDAEAVADGVEELGHLRFAREGEPPPPCRRARGRATPLPIAGAADAWEPDGAAQDTPDPDSWD